MICDISTFLFDFFNDNFDEDHQNVPANLIEMESR